MGMDAYQNRHSPAESVEDFPTQPWATRAFLHHILQDHGSLGNQTVWEPAANRGYMARPLGESFGQVIASDLKDYGVGYPVIDFLNGPKPSDFGMEVDWIITNPPFNLGLDFVLRAMQPGMAKRGVAMFLRSAWLEGKDRYERLFAVNPPSMVVQHSTRVPIVKGRVDQKASTAMPYSWFVWDHQIDTDHPQVRWIPPCRADFEREGDFDPVGVPPHQFNTRSKTYVRGSPRRTKMSKTSIMVMWLSGFVNRWHHHDDARLRNAQDTNDAHSNRVAKLVIMLDGTAEEVVEAVIHDVAEKFTGDIGYGAKREWPALRRESKIAAEFWMSRNFEFPSRPTPLVDMCDQLDAVLFCKQNAPDRLTTAKWVKHIESVLDMASGLGLRNRVEELIYTEDGGF